MTPVRIRIAKSTGTNTDRSGYQEMIDDADASNLEAVVVHSVSIISDGS